jgi:two-component system, NtrC family, response regulator AtoC
MARRSSAGSDLLGSAARLPVSQPHPNGDRAAPYDPFGNSAGMRVVKGMIDTAASTEAAALISGEVGVGKELVARAIHRESSRLGRAFIKVSCAAGRPDLLESELFGHESDAVTAADRHRPGKFVLANGGSIFLQEIGELPVALQAKLLHVLRDREFANLGGRRDARIDTRVIAATSLDLARLVDQGRFREDLYYRLSGVSITVPPLRDRVEEIPVLVEVFLDRYARQYLRPRTVVSPATMELFRAYSWPGNIRELENTVKRIVLLGSQDWLVQALGNARPPVTIPISGPATAGPARESATSGDGLSLTAIARAAALQAERRTLQQVLDRVHWNRRRAARLLNVSYRTLRRKIEQCGLLEE